MSKKVGLSPIGIFKKTGVIGYVEECVFTEEIVNVGAKPITKRHCENKIELNKSWNNPAGKTVINYSCNKTHHGKTTIHDLSCFPIIVIHQTKPGIICPVVKYAPIKAIHPNRAA